VVGAPATVVVVRGRVVGVGALVVVVGALVVVVGAIVVAVVTGAAVVAGAGAVEAELDAGRVVVGAVVSTTTGSAALRTTLMTSFTIWIWVTYTGAAVVVGPATVSTVLAVVEASVEVGSVESLEARVVAAGLATASGAPKPSTWTPVVEAHAATPDMTTSDTVAAAARDLRRSTVSPPNRHARNRFDRFGCDLNPSLP
jgi:hypothetical protein